MDQSTCRLDVAVVGLGVGEQHARAYAADPRCRLRYVHDLEESKSRSVSTALGVTRIAECYEQILDDPYVQLVSLASYDDAHYEQVVAALRRGKHVFVEKPMCRTIDELRVIKETWGKHGGNLKLSSNLVLRAAPLYRWLKDQIDAGILGEIFSFDGDYLYGRMQKITEGWRKDVVDYSVMEGGGIHLIDLMVWLTGQRPQAVTSVGNRICTEKTAFRYNDYVSATYEFSSGMIGRINANFGCVHRHQHVLRLFGTKATFICDDAGPRLHESRNPDIPPASIDYSPLPEHKGALIPAFLESIFEGGQPGVPARDVFDVISVCAAADKSLKDGERMEIQYI